jgi:hypothetical protein
MKPGSTLHAARRLARQPRTALTILAALVVIALLWWSYADHDRRKLTATVMTLTQESGMRLGEGLRLAANPPAGEAEDTASRMEAHFAAVEKHLQKLRAIDTAPVRALAEAADDYVHAAREILRRQAAALRSGLAFAQSSRMLLEHMRADSGSGAWVSEAVRLKDIVEKDYAEHRAATETLAALLESFPAAQNRIAPHVESRLLLEQDLLEKLHRQALASAQQATAEITRIRKWVPRGQGRHRND